MNITIRTLAGATLATLLASTAWAQDHTFKFQSSDPAGNPNFELQQDWAEDVAERTDGAVQIELLPVESIVAHNETQDAIAAGILDGHITDTSYFAGKDPAFGLIANPVGAWSRPAGDVRLHGRRRRQGADERAGRALRPALHRRDHAGPRGLRLQGAARRRGRPAGPEDARARRAGAAGLRRRRRGAGEPAGFRGLHLARQGRDRRGRLHRVLDQPGAGPARRRPAPGLSGLPLHAAGRDLDEQGRSGTRCPRTSRPRWKTRCRSSPSMQVAALKEADEAAVAEAKASGDITVHDWSDEERAKFRRSPRASGRRSPSGPRTRRRSMTR